MTSHASEQRTEILIVGGGTGGVAAALAAARLGRCVILTEAGDWIGGQLTSQAVPPDENPWIEQRGASESYRQMRERVRAYYRRNYPLRPEYQALVHLNPGGGWVSPLCAEPRVFLAALHEMLAPFIASRQVQIWLRHQPVAALTHADTVLAVTLQTDEGAQVTVYADFVLDATEWGDLLELADVESVIGAESQAQTGEPNALPGAPDPLDQQAATWCFALDYRPGEDHTIARPADYAFWRSYRPAFWPANLLSWEDVNPITLQPRRQGLFEPVDASSADSLWRFRRIFHKDRYLLGRYDSDITLVNWPQIDYWLLPLTGVSAAERQRGLEQARQLSLSFLYWMQTEAPNDAGGAGWPGLRLRGDVTGTTHGLAQHIYVREARRIQAEFTILEQHVGVAARSDRGAQQFPDSVGIGSYRIDLHPSSGQRSYVDVASWPAQIPLGALIPVRVQNLLPAAKNIGTTHITNGLYRMHPIEWNIGEAAGALAAFCLERGSVPTQVRNDPLRLREFQELIVNLLGFEIEWPEFIRQVPRLGNELRWAIRDWAMDDPTFQKAS
jgi:hypothetical protein